MSTPENQDLTPTPEATNSEPTAAAPKPKLNLNVAPRSTTSNLNPSSFAQKAPDRQYSAALVEDDDQPSPILNVLAGLAAAVAITFAVLLFLNTK